MSRHFVVLFCLIVFSISPSACFSQSKSLAAGAAFVDPNSSPAIVSVHELQIPGKAGAACNKGTERLAANDFVGSITDFEKAIKAFPDYYEAYAKLGAAEMSLERWDDAQAAFRKAIELSGNHYAPADFGLALILATVTNQFPEAETIVRAGLAMKPADDTGTFILAWVLYSTARLPEAERAARAAIASDPGFAAARLVLAQIHLRQNNPAAVAEDLDAYLALGVTSPLDDKIRAVRAEAQRELSIANTNSEVADARH